MTRINTNVSSLVAQNTLARSNADLNQALTRLSTGLQINTGKDNPSGLIASENLRSDIVSIKRAISNTERANQVIATADSALGQVSSLLNDIRGLVTESANTGVLSQDQIDANQLQLDSSLEALNRIAQTTSFQGRKLLDGSLDFITSAGGNFNRISSLNIDQANLGATGSIAVDISISAAATGAQVDVTSIPVAVTAVAASTTGTFTNTEVDGVVQLAIGGSTIDITTAAGFGDLLNDITDITINFGAAVDATYSGTTLTVGVAAAADTADLDEVAAAIALEAEFASAVVTGNETISVAEEAAATATVTTTGRDAGSSVITITSAAAGTAANGKTVTIVESDTVTAAAPTAVDDGTGNITVTVEDTDTTTLAAITSVIDSLTDYSASLVTTTGDGNYNPVTQTEPVVANTAGGVNGSGGITNDLIFELVGTLGSEVFSVTAGTSITQLADQINLVSDGTGVTATVNATTLEFVSSGVGSNALVDINVLSEGSGTVPAGTFTSSIGAGSRSNGTDIVARINGIDGTGLGNQITINTSTLDLTVDLAAGFFGTASFTITGGGALFQLGPDVVSNQQARIGITSVNTAQLGGVSGILIQLGTGGTADLSTDTTTAALIVDEAINQITTLRGRLGAFQRTTLETNKNALNDVMINLTEAESLIRDADFAAETAALTRAQILVQSGTTVLQIANSNPQNVLALLR